MGSQLASVGSIYRSIAISVIGLGACYAPAPTFYWWSPTSGNWNSSSLPGNPTTPSWSDPGGTTFLGVPSIADACTIAATGPSYTITLDTISNAASVLQTSAGSTVQGTNVTFNIAGTYDANAGLLSLSNSTVNGNLSFNGGSASLSGLSMQGTLSALSGPSIQLVGTTTGIGTGLFVNSTGSQVNMHDATFEGLYAGSTGEGIRITGVSVIRDSVMNGRIVLGGTVYGQGATNQIGGEVAMIGGTLYGNAGTPTTISSTGSIHGYGAIGNGSVMNFVGSKLVSDVNGQNLSPYSGSFTYQNGGLEAKNGGNMSVGGSHTGLGSSFTIEAKDGGTIAFNGASLVDSGPGFSILAAAGAVTGHDTNLTGVYAGSTGAGIYLTGVGTYTNPTVNGKIGLGGVLYLSGSTPALNSDFKLNGGTLYGHLGTTTTISSSGLMHGFGAVGNNGDMRFMGSTVSSDVSGQTLSLYTGTFTFDGGTIEAKNSGSLTLAGVVRGEGAGFTILAADGLVTAHDPSFSGLYAGSTGAGIYLSGAGTYTNATINGKIRLGGVLYLAGTAAAMNSDFKLDGGTLYGNAGTPTTISATGSIHGYGAIGNGSELILATGGRMTSDVSGQTLNFYAGTLRNQGGTILAESGTNFRLGGGSLLNESGTLKSNGTFSFDSSYDLMGGEMTGSGLFSAPTLTNSAGLVNPGDPYGLLTITGNYTQTSTGVLRVDIDGTGPGQFDRLAVSGQANLGGELQVFPTGGYVPTFGDTFRILTSNSRVNKFSITPGTQWQTIYGPNYVDIRYLVNGAAFSYPLSMEVIEGTLFEGTVFSLQQSSDDAVRIFNDEQTLRAGLELVGVAPLATFSKLWFLAETSVTRLGLAQAIQLFDYNLNRFVELNGTVASAEDQLSLIAVLTNPMRFKGPGNQVKARLLWGPINDEDPAQDGWLHDIDLARWEASP